MYSCFVPAMIFILSACSARGVEAEIKTVKVEGGGSMCSFLSAPLKGFSNDETAIARFRGYEIPLTLAGKWPKTNIEFLAAWDVSGDCGTPFALDVTTSDGVTTTLNCEGRATLDINVSEVSCK